MAKKTENEIEKGTMVIYRRIRGEAISRQIDSGCWMQSIAYKGYLSTYQMTSSTPSWILPSVADPLLHINKCAWRPRELAP